MSAADRLRNDGFSLSLNDCGALVVAPAARLDDATRAYIRQHLGEIKAALRQPFIETSRIHRAWRLTLERAERRQLIFLEAVQALHARHQADLQRLMVQRDSTARLLDSLTRDYEASKHSVEREVHAIVREMR